MRYILILAIIAMLIWTSLMLYKQPPFTESTLPTQWHDGIGYLYVPHAKIQYTNNIDFWQESTANSLGFLDREPPASIDVAIIGDSFVEGLQVPLQARIQVQFQKLTGLETAAFAYSGTGQVAQLPFYTEFARSFDPEYVVLVFGGSDFRNNSPELESLVSSSAMGLEIDRVFNTEQLAPSYQNALTRTDAALAEWKRLSQRNNFKLIILIASHTIELYGKTWHYQRIMELANKHQIAVVDQYDYIMAHGYEPQALHWQHDIHWNETGHRTAALALADYFNVD